MQQNSDALLDRSLGFGTENCVIVVTDRVRNDGKRESWPPRYLGHRLGCLHEAIRNDSRGSDTGILGGHGVVQTTRRAATSIAHGCDNRVTALHVCQYLGRCWPTRIRLAEAQHLRHAKACAEDCLDMVE